MKKIFKENLSDSISGTEGINPVAHCGQRLVSMVGAALALSVTLVVIALAMGFMVTHANANNSVSTKELTPTELQAANIRQVNGEYQKDFNQSVPLPANGVLNLAGQTGKIEVYGWNSNSVLVTAVIHGSNSRGVSDVNVYIQSDSQGVAINTEGPSHRPDPFRYWLRHGHHDMASVTVDYIVHVPASARTLNINSANGDVAVNDFPGDITAITINGSARVKGAMHNVKLSSVYGQLSATLATLGSGQSVCLNTINGAIILTAPTATDAAFSADTVNGDITSGFSELKPQNNFSGPSNNLKGTIGHGAAVVTANTINGSIHFERQTPPDTKLTAVTP